MKKVHLNKKQTPVHSSSDIITDWALRIMICVLLVVTTHFVRRIFIAERFKVPSNSMQPTLVPGDKIWVNKMLIGARIYKSLDFEDHAPLKCFRMPGIRDIRPGDVICFNNPLGYDEWTKIEFKINYVYCKRVVGTPGDTIGVKDGFTWNNNYEGFIGVLENQKRIHDTPDSILWRTTFMATMPFTRPMWTIKNFGPLYIPQKGVTIELDSIGRAIYGPVIEYETGSWPADDLTSHTFIHDYYFAFGDNSMDSNDSRYWGFIPEDFIIGIVAGRKVRNNPNQTFAEEGKLD
ncbi:MAG: signal peptidase I [Bacteroidaceae bacterium]|nr:signal peptidase I [Bacteroidaceae bacterium]